MFEKCSGIDWIKISNVRASVKALCFPQTLSLNELFYEILLLNYFTTLMAPKLQYVPSSASTDPESSCIQCSPIGYDFAAEPYYFM